MTISSRVLAAAAVATLVAAPLATIASPASAATKYSSCANLTRDFPNGVAKSKAAAAKQVRQGNSRPASGKRAQRVYHANSSNLDRDKDGTACEN